MPRTTSSPVGVTHQGKVVYFVRATQTHPPVSSVEYNILDLQLDSTSDNEDWTGYQELTPPPELAPGGMSVLTTQRTIDTSGLLCAVSDQHYIYLFSTDGSTILCDRYVMVDNPEATQTSDRWLLQPAWQVRYQRSKSADVPASKKDTSGYVDLEGRPFIKPAIQLTLGTGDESVAMDLSGGTFAVLLTPTGDGDTLRWQFFCINQTDSKLYSYSIARSEDGGFALDGRTLDAQTCTLRPDAIVELVIDEVAATLSGPPGATVYLKQEKVVTEGQGTLKLSQVHRVMLAVQATTTEATPRKGLATLDFAVGADGYLALLEPSAPDQPVPIRRLNTGIVSPAEYSLEFDGQSWVALPSESGYVTGSTFTVEAWVHPHIEDDSMHGFMGSDEKNKDAAPLTLWIENRLKVGFGFGAQDSGWVEARSTDNILIPGAWNHIAVTFSDQGVALYHNGREVPHSGDLTRETLPISTPITRLGGGHGERLTGMMHEVRAWNVALSGDAIRERMYTQISAEEAREDPNLEAYWRLNQGSGTSAPDLAGKGEGGQGYPGDLDGAQWIASSAPIVAEDSPITHFDTRDLSLVVGIAFPHGDGLEATFGAIADGTRPWLLAAADGMVHCYYAGDARAEHQALVAQFDTSITRAMYAAPWRAGRGEDQVRDDLYFVARQAGDAINAARLSTTASSESQALMDLRFEDSALPASHVERLEGSSGASETYLGVPRDVRSVVAVVNGLAIDNVTDPRTRAAEAVFYDYSGDVPMAFHELGEPELASYLQFVSLRTKDFACVGVDIADGSSAEYATITVHIASDEAHPEEVLTCAFEDVPRLTSAFMQTLLGVNDAYDYATQGSSPADTPAYAITAGTSEVYEGAIELGVTSLLVFVPEEATTLIRIEITDGPTPEVCTLEVGLEISGQPEPVETIWERVERTSDAIAAAITEEPGEVGAYLRLLAPSMSQTIPNQTVTKTASSILYLSFFEVLARDASAQVSNATLTLSAIQGATTNSTSHELATGSHLFRAVNSREPANGYRALLDTGDRPALLARPGVDGGWIAESPRNAVRTSGGGGLTVDFTRNQDVLLDVDALTMEAWCNLDTPPGYVPGQAGVEFPRILHFNPEDDPTRSRYMLGLRATVGLQVLKEARIETSDVEVARDIDRLGSGSAYTVQLYVLADLSSTTQTNQLWRLRFDEVGHQTLSVTPEGQLVFTSEAGEEQQTVESSETSLLPTKQWHLLTVVVDAGSVTLLLDDQVVGAGDLKPLTSPSHTFTVAGNAHAPNLQFLVNEVAFWNRARPTSEVAQDVRTPVPRDDQALVLLWPLNLDLGSDTRVDNEAETTIGYYDTHIEAETMLWITPGVFYRAFAAVGEAAFETRSALLAPNVWGHIAATYEPLHGIRTSANDWAVCGSDDSLNVNEGLSVATWVDVEHKTSTLERVLLSKWGSTPEQRSYQCGLSPSGKPFLKVALEVVDESAGPIPPRQAVQTFVAPKALHDTQAHITVTAEVISITNASGAGSISAARTSTVIDAQIYVDGQPVLPGRPEATEADPGTYELRVIGGSGSGFYAPGETVTITHDDPRPFTTWASTAGDIEALDQHSTTLTMPSQAMTATCVGLAQRFRIQRSSAPVAIGRAQLGVQSPSLNLAYPGIVADMQLWSRALGRREVDAYVRTLALPPQSEGLVSRWTFEAQTGRLARDAHYGNDAQLGTSEMWREYHASATMSIFINGERVAVHASRPGRYDGYGSAQFQFGNMFTELRVSDNGLAGRLDEIRIWRERRTDEQITDNMYAYLIGDEPHLAGYWRFDVGSGQMVVDRTVWGHHASFESVPGLEAPTWVESTAPISNEAPQVRNTLGGLDTSYVQEVSEGPVVLEYGDTQRDSRGELLSVIKRAYVLESSVGVTPIAGYKVGDLTLVYVGQIQTEPTLVGYIEGAPPLPSENLTRPFWYDPTKPAYLGYYDSSSVTLSESEVLDINIASSSQQGRNHAFGFSLSAGADSKSDQVIGVPPAQTTIQTVKVEGRLGGGAEVEWGKSDGRSNGIGNTLSRQKSYHFYNCGDWEAPGATYLDSGERRFIPNNEGLAVVRSLVADLYSTHLRSTGALVSLIAIPNPDIPEDVNLVYFPIEPSYVKNGTLDGRLGLQPDPAYRNVADTHNSYYKPVEAYSLKRRIEARNLELEGYYTQTDARTLGRDGTIDLSSIRQDNPLYDFGQRVPRQGMISTYVWTAAGGLYSEQVGYTNVIQESFQGANLFASVGKVFGELDFALGPIGVKTEAHYNTTMTQTKSVSKSRSKNAALGLEVQADPDGFLSKFIGGDAAPFQQPSYTSSAVPGKVDSYRFMSLYLPPDSNNAERFFDTVVDQQWLRTSPDARAAALRQTQASTAGVWRLMHRVTYVSRIPPSFQVLPVSTDGPRESEPSNLAHNDMIIALVQQRLGTEQPTPVEIGEAVQSVLSQDLVKILPWWADFQIAASEPNSDAQRLWESLMSDTMAYMTQYYATVG